MSTALAILGLSLAAGVILLVAFTAPRCDRTSVPGPVIGGVLMIEGCRR